MLLHTSINSVPAGAVTLLPSMVIVTSAIFPQSLCCGQRALGLSNLFGVALHVDRGRKRKLVSVQRSEQWMARYQAGELSQVVGAAKGDGFATARRYSSQRRIHGRKRSLRMKHRGRFPFARAVGGESDKLHVTTGIAVPAFRCVDAGE